jgi:hypothetical protein
MAAPLQMPPRATFFVIPAHAGIQFVAIPSM